MTKCSVGGYCISSAICSKGRARCRQKSLTVDIPGDIKTVTVLYTVGLFQSQSSSKSMGCLVRLQWERMCLALIRIDELMCKEGLIPRRTDLPFSEKGKGQWGKRYGSSELGGKGGELQSGCKPNK